MPESAYRHLFCYKKALLLADKKSTFRDRQSDRQKQRQKTETKTETYT